MCQGPPELYEVSLARPEFSTGVLTIGGIEARRVWVVVIRDRVIIHQLADIRSAVAILLEP